MEDMLELIPNDATIAELKAALFRSFENGGKAEVVAAKK